MKALSKIILPSIFLYQLILTTALAQTTNSIDFSKVVYACTPCGDGACDNTYYDKAGICPVCNMDLIATYKGLTFSPSHLRASTPTVAILLYPGVDVMDLSGPYSVFGYAHMRIVTVAKTDELVRAGGGLKIKPDYTFKTFQGADILVVPGGGPAERDQDPDIIAWIKEADKKSKNILSVCSGAFFLAKAGVLNSQSATTFASLIPQLTKDAPNTKVVSDKRFVDNGRIITSAGLTSGIDAAFRFVEKYYGQGRAQQVANQMEYNWDPSVPYVRALLADKYVEHPMSALAIFTDSLVSHSGNRNFWETRILVSPTIPTEKYARLVETNLLSNSNWKKQSSSGLNSQWRFNGDDNSTWICYIRSSGYSENASQVTIRVEKQSGNTN